MRLAFPPATNDLDNASIVAALWLAILPFSHTIALRYSLFVLAVLLVLPKRQESLFRDLPMRGAFLAWIAAACLSLLGAAQPLESLRDIKSELLMGFAAFWLFHRLGLESRRAGLLIVGLCVSLLCGGILLVCQYFPALPQWLRQYYPGHGVWSTWLALSLPVLLACTRLTQTNPAMRNLVWLCLACVLILGYLTFNRTLWITMICVTLIFAWTERRLPSAHSIFSTRQALALISVALLLMFYIHDLRLENAASVPITVHLDQDPRPKLWRYCLQLIIDGPLFGAGFGQDVYKHSLTTALGNPLLWHGHNLFINAGLQMGLPGILAVSWIMISAARQFSSRSDISNAVHRIVGTGGLALVAALVVKNFTDDFFVEQNALLFWAMTGLGLGYRLRIETEIRAH
jgi:hypothetical protein